MLKMACKNIPILEPELVIWDLTFYFKKKIKEKNVGTQMKGGCPTFPSFTKLPLPHRATVCKIHFQSTSRVKITET